MYSVLFDPKDYVRCMFHQLPVHALFKFIRADGQLGEDRHHKLSPTESVIQRGRPNDRVVSPPRAELVVQVGCMREPDATSLATQHSVTLVGPADYTESQRLAALQLLLRLGAAALADVSAGGDLTEIEEVASDCYVVLSPADPGNDPAGDNRV